jgi:4-carboxymuconolactone decarboxylase
MSEPREVSAVQKTIRAFALVVVGTTEQFPFHLNEAKANGVSEAGLIEVIADLAFDSGWPKSMSAVMVAKEVVRK